MNSTHTQSQSQSQTRITLNGNTFTLALADTGHGRIYLLLHGGAGPGSVMGLARALSLSNAARALVPTHPGFQGQARPEWLLSVPDLASAYLAMLEAMDLKDVIVVGNSLGGWIAGEMATRKSPRVYGGQYFTFDPTLRARLGQIEIPALVAWGESDRIVDVAYGREFAESLPGARFVTIPEAGHLPQIEKTAAVVELLRSFPAGR